MALKTMLKKFDDAKKAYEKQLKVLGKELQQEIVPGIAALIPEGWYLTWHQSDEQYNDEDYYFGVDNLRIVTERVPRQGKLLKDEVPRKVERKQDIYGRWNDEVVQYYQPAEYEWILDGECEKRDPDDDDSYEGEPGVIMFNSYGKPQLGLKKSDYKELENLMSKIGDDNVRRAFGEQATVRIYRSGKCVVNNDETEE